MSKKKKRKKEREDLIKLINILQKFSSNIFKRARNKNNNNVSFLS